MKSTQRYPCSTPRLGAVGRQNN